MKELRVELGTRSYPIYIGQELISSAALLREIVSSSQVMIVSNTTVAPLYLQQLLDSLKGLNVRSYIIEDGESFKNLSVMNDIITELLQKKFSRNCCLIALGGGVVGDITGFSAACYQRGSKYIQIPTTLLAQVDSSVGGKTAVNHKLGKNMIGAFYQPVAVIADSSVLNTLPDRELIAGIAEVIKYGLIRDHEFFVWLEENIEKLLARDEQALAWAIERSCLNKAEIVAEDEREQGQRALLNYGHTFAHALETGLAYKTWLHGEAVGMGMLMAAELSYRMQWLSKQALERIRNILTRAGLPQCLPAELATVNIRDLMAVDKKARDGELFLVLLRGIGQAELTGQYNESLLSDTLQYFSSQAGRG